jgi:hypothetical protein
LGLQNYSKWILDNRILEFIFGENSHSELIKRSLAVLYLMAQNADTFPDEILQMLWSCCSPEKHEDIIRATYELITELARCLPMPRVKFMYEKIQTIPMQNIDQKTVIFLKDYTLNTMKNLQAKKVQQAAAAANNKRSNTGKGGERPKRVTTVVSGGDSSTSKDVQAKKELSEFELFDC